MSEIEHWKAWKLTKQSPEIFKSEYTVGDKTLCETCKNDFGVFSFLLPKIQKIIKSHIKCLTQNIFYQKNIQAINYEKNKNKYFDLKKKHQYMNKQKHQQRKIVVIDHYTNNKRECMCCGYPGIEFLTVDHMNNDGVLHRRRVGSNNVYKDIIRNDFPRDIQILCFNCNTAKHHNKGLCPHLFLKRPREILQ